MKPDNCRHDPARCLFMRMQGLCAYTQGHCATLRQLGLLDHCGRQAAATTHKARTK